MEKKMNKQKSTRNETVLQSPEDPAFSFKGPILYTPRPPPALSFTPGWCASQSLWGTPPEAPLLSSASPVA